MTLSPLHPVGWRRRHRRPLAGHAAPAGLQSSIVLFWLHALDSADDDGRDQRRLHRFVSRELELGPRAASQRIDQAFRIMDPARSFELLRGGLDLLQRERVLGGAYELARRGGRCEYFERISAPVLANWLGLSGCQMIQTKKFTRQGRWFTRRPGMSAALWESR